MVNAGALAGAPATVLGAVGIPRLCMYASSMAFFCGSGKVASMARTFGSGCMGAIAKIWPGVCL